MTTASSSSPTTRPSPPPAAHDGDPVPYLIYDSRTDTHNDLPYTEEAGLKGPFMDNGVNLMAALFEQD